MKIIIKVLLLISAVGYITFAIMRLSQPAGDVVCNEINIVISDSIEQSYLRENYVRDLMQKNKISPEGQKISQIDMPGIETALRDDAYISDAKCFHTATGRLCIHVKAMQPILHVIAQNGEDYYMDQSGECMPAENFNLNLNVATGQINKDFAKEKLIELAGYIYDDTYWNERIVQIHVVSNKKIMLTSRYGEQKICLGDIDNLEEKFSKLKLFYEEALPKIGWNKYETINLAFNGQIVCTRKK